MKPCITIVLYWGSEKWNVGKDLLSLMDFTDIPEEMGSLFQNYQMHLIEMRQLENTDIFHTDIKNVVDFIKKSEDSEGLVKLAQENLEYQNLDEDAYDMIAAYTNSEELIRVREFYEEGGKVNMCKAITELIANGKADGIAEGKAEGKVESIIDLLSDLGEVSDETTALIMNQRDLDILNVWLKLAARANSIEEFENRM